MAQRSVGRDMCIGERVNSVNPCKKKKPWRLLIGSKFIRTNRGVGGDMGGHWAGGKTS